MWVCPQSLQSCPTLQPHGRQPPGSSAHGIPQARMLQWVAMPSSRGSSWPRDWTRITCMAGRVLTAEPLGRPNNKHECLVSETDLVKPPGCDDHPYHWPHRCSDMTLDRHLPFGLLKAETQTKVKTDFVWILEHLSLRPPSIKRDRRCKMSCGMDQPAERLFSV